VTGRRTHAQTNHREHHFFTSSPASPPTIVGAVVVTYTAKTAKLIADPQAIVSLSISRYSYYVNLVLRYKHKWYLLCVTAASGGPSLFTQRAPSAILKPKNRKTEIKLHNYENIAAASTAARGSVARAPCSGYSWSYLSSAGGSDVCVLCSLGLMDTYLGTTERPKAQRSTQ
jgi:hypothetical protein